MIDKNLNEDFEDTEETKPDICDCKECEECIKEKGECTCGDCDVCLKETNIEDGFDDAEPEDLLF